MPGGFGVFGFGTGPFGTAEEDTGPFYFMRARNAGHTAYVLWVADGFVDTAGVEAPFAIDVATITVAAAWGFPTPVISFVQTFNGLQSVAAPAAITNLGTGYLLVMVDTADVGWSPSDVLTLPASPTAGFRVLVKDSTGAAGTKPIVIDGNGKLIDGGSNYTLSIAYAAVDLIYNGTSWVVY